MKHLILGSDGQIGHELQLFLMSQGHEVLTFDLVSSDLQDLRIRKNPALIQKIVECDFVYFLAFDVGGSRYLQTYQHELQFISNNTRIMENTFELLDKYRKPFIFASSQMSNMSYSPYGVLKALGESYTKALGGIVVKFWNVYGIERDFEKSHVITDFLLKARNTKCIDMLTDGSEVRQFLHAQDCSRCLLTLAALYGTIDRKQQLHVTSFDWISILEIAEIVQALYPATTILAAKSKDTVQQDARNEPDRSILAYWQPEISLSKGISIVNSSI